MEASKSAAIAVPPLSFVTSFMIVILAGLSSFVIVQVLVSPSASVIVPSGLQSPVIVP